MKILTTIRVGKKQKKIEIEIPRLEDFIHKSYIQVARKLYTNVYLYEKYVTPLQKQKHTREIEIIVQECILNAIRETLPIESVLRSYMDESIEEDYIETIQEEKIPIKEVETEKERPDETEADKLKVEADALTISTQESNDKKQGISFNDNDSVMSRDNKEEIVNAPKTIERLEQISNMRNEERKLEDDDDDDDDGDNSFKIKIGGDVEKISLDSLTSKEENIILSDIEELK